jgi:hypothetical protein
MMRKWAVLGALAVSIVGGAISQASATDGNAGSQAAKGAGPRPWKALPVTQFATLDEGVVRGRFWGIYAFSRQGAGGSKRPCIEEVTLQSRHGVPAFSTAEPSCGGLTPPQKHPVTVEYIFSNVQGSVLGMTVASSVRTVELQRSDGRTLKLPTELLSTKQAKKAKVRQFRFIAIGLARKGCLESVRGLSEAGEILFETAPAHCLD